MLTVSITVSDNPKMKLLDIKTISPHILTYPESVLQEFGSLGYSEAYNQIELIDQLETKAKSRLLS